MLLSIQPALVYRTRIMTVATFGKQKRGDFDLVTQFCRARDTHLDYIVYPPSNETGAGFQSIYQGSPNANILADGVLLLPGQSGVIQARDCPTVALEYRATQEGEHRAVLFHAGRAALTSPQDCTACGYTIVSSALKAVAPRGDYGNVHAYITAGICQDCFVHPSTTDERLVAPFRQYPGVVDDRHDDRRLDVIEVIRFELRGRGVPDYNIKHDGTCTKENTALSSKRGGDTTYNYVLGSLRT